MPVNLLPVCYWHELLDLVYFYKATHNMIHLDPSVVPFVRECARRTRISVTSSQSFVPKKCRTSTFQKSFFIRTTRIWNLLITRLELDNVTFENFKSVLYSHYPRVLAINYDPDSPRNFKSINFAWNVTQPGFWTKKVAAACDLNCYFYIFFGSTVIGFCCCGVPISYCCCIVTFLLLVFAYLPGFFYLFILQGKAKKI